MSASCPDLFREGQGVVVLGTMQRNGVFHASEVLAKHSENYMPKEVEAALKKSGHWNPECRPAAAAVHLGHDVGEERDKSRRLSYGCGARSDRSGPIA